MSQPEECRRGLLVSLPQAGSPQISKVCDAEPLRRQTYGYLPSRRASPPLDRTELYCLVTETNEWEQLAQGCCLKAELRGMGIGSRDPLSRRVQRPNHYTIRPYYTGMSVLRICDCHTFRLLLHFLHISTKCTYPIFFSHTLAFSTAILILFVFLLPISIRFRYLDHLVDNRMAPSTCPDPCGKIWGSWF